MDNFGVIRKKLKRFTQRFYFNELIRGFIFFFAIGLLYFLIVLFIEYTLWLDPLGRTVLFWSFLIIEGYLFFRFIMYPILKLFRISKGIDERSASILIGRHFPEVGDKLLNVVQLKNDREQTELLLAGIDQKAKELRPVPFSLAIDYRQNLKYLKFAAIPISIILVILFLGKTDFFTSSYKRVVDYRTVYHPPAPFSFRLTNNDLTVREGETLNLEVITDGRIFPEEVSIHYDDQTYYMDPTAPGIFRYSFENINDSFEFHLSANEVNSESYRVEVLKVPKTVNLKMELKFPEHTGIPDEVIDGTGNATVPEGTLITWKLETKNTENVRISYRDSIKEMDSEKGIFRFSKKLVSPLNYKITTSNHRIRDYETSPYSIRVVIDELPFIEVNAATDTINSDVMYFQGKVSDDYGISSIDMIFHPVQYPEQNKIRRISNGKGTVETFFAVFPDTLQLISGQEYEVFFQVTDNDRVNGYKTVKSRSFFYRKQTETEEKENLFKEQGEAIQGIENLMQEEDRNAEILEGYEKEDPGSMNYRKRKQLENYIKRQKQQNQLFERYTRQLKRTFENEKNPFNEEMREELMRRLSQKEREIEESEDLLRELEELTEKIEAEDLQKKLEEFSRKNKGRERSLEQLLELTKRYYIQEKINRLAEEIKDLGQVQEDLGEEQEFNKESQDSLGTKTKETLKELDAVKEQNKELKKPLDLGDQKDLSEEILDEQKKAGEENLKGNKNKAKDAQKEAGEKLKELSSKIGTQMRMGDSKQMEEDVDMLRQILDNLVVFSFEQEDLLEEFRAMGNNHPSFATKLREQNFLKDNFKHIDDSIYSLALRNPMITEEITGKLTDVSYHLEKSLERLSNNELGHGISSQQYVITGANDLAYFLSNTLQNMQRMLGMAGGTGKGGNSNGMQLPDLIKKQKSIGEELKDGMKKRNRSGEKGGSGGSPSEEMSEELYNIFKEQQRLRMELEEKLKNSGNEGRGRNVIEDMKKLEEKLLNKGFDQENLKRINDLEHKLLDLEEAELEQGKKNERQAERTRGIHENVSENLILKAKEYFNATEILNRQTLPLRQNYKLKVNEYFEGKDD